MPRLVLVSDTHLPVRARDLPPEVWAALDDLGPEDLVVHAGDWVDEATLDQLLARLAPAAVPLLACWGNNDGPALRARLPEVARAVVGGVRVAVVHETGPATGRGPRAAAAFGADTDLLVFGHSHIPWDTRVELAGGGSLHLLNPGSPTDRRRQPQGTFLTAVLFDGEVRDVVLHPVPVRATARHGRSGRSSPGPTAPARVVPRSDGPGRPGP